MVFPLPISFPDTQQNRRTFFPPRVTFNRDPTWSPPWHRDHFAEHLPSVLQVAFVWWRSQRINSGSQNSSNANWIFLMSWRRSRPPKNHGSSLETIIRYRPGHNIKELFDIGWGLLKYWHTNLITNDNNYIILFQITIVASHVWVSFHTNHLQWGRSDVSVSRDPIFLCRLNYRLRNETILYPIYGILVG
jgi:hypothetical protein